MVRTKDMRDVESFFDLLDRYLIGDLDVMVYQVCAGETGGLGYPTMQAILSGMELLGLVLSGGAKKVDKAFKYFWDEYFVEDNPQYKLTGLCEIFRDCVRNGIAHSFLLKFGVRLSKAGKANLTTKGENLNIDVKCFYKDFKKTYLRVKCELCNACEGNDLLITFNKGYTKLIEILEVAKRCKVDKFMADNPNIPKAPERLQGETGSLDESP